MQRLPGGPKGLFIRFSLGGSSKKSIRRSSFLEYFQLATSRYNMVVVRPSIVRYPSLTNV